MQRANAAVAGSAPKLLGVDEATGALAMQFLPADRYSLWKTQLRDGDADPEFAAQVADTLVRIHGFTAASPSIAADFQTDRIFYDIRLEPYLVATAQAHPDLAQQLHDLVSATQASRHALTHGDVSPKNILRGPGGPVFLDAECAWWGDPAFDLAFCLNHLMLKCLWVPAVRPALFDSFSAMTTSYLPLVACEPAATLEARAAHLLPALFLARVDGKSPVEYITEDIQRDAVRRVARCLLLDPPDRLADVAQAWKKEVAA